MALAAQRRVTPLVDLLFSRGLAGTRYELPSLFSSLLWNLLPLWCFLLGLAGVLWGRLYIAAPFFLFALGHAGKTLLDYPPWRKPCEELPEAQGEWAVPALLRGVAAKEPPLRGYGLIWIEKAGRFYPARMRGLFDVLSPGTPLSLTALAGQAVTAKGYFRWRGFPVLDVTELVAPDGRRIRSRHLLWQLLWSSAMAGAALFHMILQRMESP